MACPRLKQKVRNTKKIRLKLPSFRITINRPKWKIRISKFDKQHQKRPITNTFAHSSLLKLEKKRNAEAAPRNAPPPQKEQRAQSSLPLIRDIIQINYPQQSPLRQNRTDTPPRDNEQKMAWMISVSQEQEECWERWLFFPFFFF